MSATELFGDPISVYTREQAIEDGALIDVSETAREVGIGFPVAMTAAAWANLVSWSDEDSRRKGTAQDEAGRLWDVLWMLRLAARRGGSELCYSMVRTPREGRGRMPRRATVKAICGPGDDLEPVITVMLPHED